MHCRPTALQADALLTELSQQDNQDFNTTPLPPQIFQKTDQAVTTKSIHRTGPRFETGIKFAQLIEIGPEVPKGADGSANDNYPINGMDNPAPNDRSSDGAQDSIIRF